MRFKRRFWPTALLPVLLPALLFAAPAAGAASPAAQHPRPKPAPQQPAKIGPLQQADDAVARGNLDFARREYERALNAGVPLQKDFVRARNLGLCYMNGNPPRLRDAVVWLQSAWQLRPADENTELLLAQALAWSRRFSEAAVHYRTLAAAHADNADYALALANALYGAGDSAGALSALDSFLQRYPSNTPVRLQYAGLLSFAKQYAASIGQYKHVLEFDPHNAAAQTGVAKVSSWQGQLNLALELFDKALQEHPGYYDALAGKAFTLLWMGKDEESRPWFEAAAARNPSDPEVARALKGLGPAPAKAAAKPAAPPRPEEKPPLPPTSADINAVAGADLSSPAPELKVEPIHPADAALQAAEAASGRGDYPAAIAHYREALKLRPADSAARLRLARVLSWATHYAESAAEYEALLQADPTRLDDRVEKARVLSWGRQFDASLAEYARVVRELEAHPADTHGVSLSDVRLQYARVLGWADRYDDSLRQFALLLPPDHVPQMQDRAVLLEEAKVLSWARRYDDSIRAYDQALALHSDFDARLGRAQVQYWSGHLHEARSELLALRRQQPRNPKLNFLLAAVEGGLGSKGRALAYLDYAPPDQETAKLRSSIRQQLRPVLSFRSSLEDDREVDAGGPASGIKVLRHSATLAFYPLPDLPLEVTTTASHGVTSNSTLRQFGGDAWATESLLRTTLGVTRWLRLIAGAGGATSGGGVSASGELVRRYHFVYELHPIITRGAFRLDATATQHVADYTPLAIHNNVVQRRESVAPSYTWRKRLRLAAEYWRADYSLESPSVQPSSFQTAANGGSVEATAIVIGGERLTVEAGPRFEIFSFDDRAADIATAIASSGFFTPRVYERIAAAGHVIWNPRPHLHFDASGTVGPQRIFGFDSLAPLPAVFRNVGSFGAQAAVDLRRFTPVVRYDYFSTATAAFLGTPGVVGSGSYQSQSFTLGLTYHF